MIVQISAADRNIDSVFEALVTDCEIYLLEGWNADEDVLETPLEDDYARHKLDSEYYMYIILEDWRAVFDLVTYHRLVVNRSPGEFDWLDKEIGKPDVQIEIYNDYLE